jgi:prepilin-type N-terminal cleavage/methylation domain-containing protein
VRASEAGFSLIELLVASALFTVLAFGAFELLRSLGANAAQLAARQSAYAALDGIVDRLRSEARSATAIWASAPSAGGGHDDCVQLDFFAADASGPKFWSYRDFPNHGTADAIPSGALERVAGTGPLTPCDPAASGEVVLSGLVAPPLVTPVPPAQLAAHLDPYLQQNDSPFVAASVPPTAPISLGVLDARGNPLGGGNTILDVQLANTAGVRSVELLPGVFPNGYTEVLRYVCSERCDVGHDSPTPKTLTACVMTWQTQWSQRVNAGAATGWFVGGTFSFNYSGVRADGGTDTFTQVDAASNWDPSRNYTAFPPAGPAANGSEAGTLTPWDVRVEAPGAWYTDFAPYIAAAQGPLLAADKHRCDVVQQAGAAGAFYANG